MAVVRYYNFTKLFIVFGALNYSRSVSSRLKSGATFSISLSEPTNFREGISFFLGCSLLVWPIIQHRYRVEIVIKMKIEIEKGNMKHRTCRKKQYISTATKQREGRQHEIGISVGGVYDKILISTGNFRAERGRNAVLIYQPMVKGLANPHKYRT